MHSKVSMNLTLRLEISNALRDNIKIVDQPKFIENILEREQAKNILLKK